MKKTRRPRSRPVSSDSNSRAANAVNFRPATQSAVEAEAHLAAKAATALAGICAPPRFLDPAIRPLADIARAVPYKLISEMAAQHAAIVAAIEPMVREYEQTVQKARAGERSSLIALIEAIGIDILGDDEIRQQVTLLDKNTPSGRRARERIVDAIRVDLLTPRKPGRPPGTPEEAAKWCVDLQAAYDSRPLRLKARYNNPAAMRLDIRAISKHVASSVPPARREATQRAAEDVLTAQPRIGKAFGIEVVAKSLCRSSRHIRSLTKKKRSRK